MSVVDTESNQLLQGHVHEVLQFIPENQLAETLRSIIKPEASSLGRSTPKKKGTSSSSTRTKKNAPRRSWSQELHQHFVKAWHKLASSGIQPSPKKLMILMREQGAPMDDLTIRQVQSHHQKYKLKLIKQNGDTFMGSITAAAATANSMGCSVSMIPVASPSSALRKSAWHHNTMVNEEVQMPISMMPCPSISMDSMLESESWEDITESQSPLESMSMDSLIMTTGDSFPWLDGAPCLLPSSVSLSKSSSFDSGLSTPMTSPSFCDDPLGVVTGANLEADNGMNLDPLNLSGLSVTGTRFLDSSLFNMRSELPSFDWETSSDSQVSSPASCDLESEPGWAEMLNPSFLASFAEEPVSSAP